jgi:tRNA1(Val) A37 N6-methylase TrmN6
VIDVSREEPAPGLTVWQPQRGFRYGLDAILLAGWALEGGRPKRFLDVGTGSGIVALLLARMGIPGVGIDVRSDWIELARRSAADSGLDNVSFLHGDVRTAAIEGIDLVLANPPYRQEGQGTMSPDARKAAATHELSGTLAELVAAMCRLGDRVALVLPLQREAEARDALARARSVDPYEYHHPRNLAALQRRWARASPPDERRVHLDEADGFYGAATAMAPEAGTLWA